MANTLTGAASVLIVGVTTGTVGVGVEPDPEPEPDPDPAATGVTGAEGADHGELSEAALPALLTNR